MIYVLTIYEPFIEISFVFGLRMNAARAQGEKKIAKAYIKCSTLVTYCPNESVMQQRKCYSIKKETQTLTHSHTQ